MKSPATAAIATAAVLLASCEPPEPPPDGHAPPSAVVELQRAPTAAEIESPTRVIVLGSGNPIPDARRAGPGIAVVHRGRSYLFDVGAGVVHNATIARYRYEVPSLYPLSICCVFLTHLHNDHTADLPELAGTLWWRRTRPLNVYGPDGTAEMMDGMFRMFAPDFRIRSSGTQPVSVRPDDIAHATEIEPGMVYQADDITIEAFDVEHGRIRPAFGYRITTHDRTIVISGDTAPSENLASMAEGADLLFHEVISDAGVLNTAEAMQAYHRSSHTVATELGRLAARVRPGKLVLYHGLFYGVRETQVVDEVRSTYDGPVVLANDLDAF